LPRNLLMSFPAAAGRFCSQSANSTARNSDMADATAFCLLPVLSKIVFDFLKLNSMVVRPHGIASESPKPIRLVFGAQVTRQVR